MKNRETAVAIDYDPATDVIDIVGKPIQWGQGRQRYEASRREVTGWPGYTHLVKMQDTLAWEGPAYWLVGPT